MLNRNYGLFATIAILALYGQAAPAQGTWRQLPAMKSPRNAYPLAVNGSTGNIFMIGGRYNAPGYTTATTEYVNLGAPTISFNKTGNLYYSRSYMPAVPLQGTTRVLLPGGFSASYGTLRTAEVFDTSTGTSKTTNSMSYGREQFDAVQLASGQVLAIGGFNGNYNTAYKTAELYTVSTGRWSATASMNTPRFGTTSLRLPDGRVLVVGGRTEPGDASLSSVEYYLPASGTVAAAWTQSPAPGVTPPTPADSDWTPYLHFARFRHTMTVIGTDAGGYPILLVTGGYSGNGSAGKTINNAEVGAYDSGSAQYKFQVLRTADASGVPTQEEVQMLFVNAGRMDHTATALASIGASSTAAQVFVVGGWDGITGGAGTTISLPELITVNVNNGVYTGALTHLAAPPNFQTRHEQAALPITFNGSAGALICGGLEVDSYGNASLNDAWIYTLN